MTAFPRIDTLTTPPVVGETYLVPCIIPIGRVEWWPTLGGVHADPELGVPSDHQHYDVRFLSERQIRVLARDCHVPDRDALFAAGRCAVKAGYITDRLYRPKRCLRELHEQGYFGAALEARYAGETLLDGICPHRGANLRSVPVVDGCKTCPLHGLRWDAETGVLIPRREEGRV